MLDDVLIHPNVLMKDAPSRGQAFCVRVHRGVRQALGINTRQFKHHAESTGFGEKNVLVDKSAWRKQRIRFTGIFPGFDEFG
jgi:hypothetical protein